MLKKVVLVDDNEADLVFGDIILERSGVAAAVVSFDSAAEALDHLAGPEGSDVDCVLLDINMPGMDGFEFLQAYEALFDAGARAIVVMLTSSPDPRDQERARAFRSVKGFITKPITPDHARGLVRCPRGFVACSSRVRSPEKEIGPMKKRYSEEQIIGFLREADAGLPLKELCRKHGFSEASYYAWKAKFGGMKVSDAQRLKALEAENGKLKRLLANSMLEVDAMREVLKGK